MKKSYEVPEDRLRELLATEADFISLESEGVDNWQGYSEVEWIDGEDVDITEFEEVSP
jgi:hypothetical protein